MKLYLKRPIDTYQENFIDFDIWSLVKIFFVVNWLNFLLMMFSIIVVANILEIIFKLVGW